MKISLSIPQRAALTAGVTLMGVGIMVGGVSFVPENKAEVPTVEFGRGAGACAACGAAAPMTIVTPGGTVWNITGPGSVQAMLEKYCPAGQTCSYTVG